jgi:hypothetical protein
MSIGWVSCFSEALLLWGSVLDWIGDSTAEVPRLSALDLSRDAVLETRKDVPRMPATRAAYNVNDKRLVMTLK